MKKLTNLVASVIEVPPEDGPTKSFELRLTIQIKSFLWPFPLDYKRAEMPYRRAFDLSP